MGFYKSLNLTARGIDKKTGKVKYQARARYKDETKKSGRSETTKIIKGVGKREAKRIAEEWFAELNRQAALTPIPNKDDTVTEIVEQHLYQQLNNGEIEKSSYTLEQATLRNYITPYIGNNGFFTMTRDSINIWLTKLNQRGLSQNTIATAYYLLKKIYDYHYSIENITKNPFNGVKAPKRGAPKVTHLTKTQMDDYLRAVYEDFTPNDSEYYAFLLAFYTGLRRGEICALRVRDIDFANGTISVESSIGESTDGFYTKQPKSKSSIRKFPLVPQMLEVLRHKQGEDGKNFVCGQGINYYKPDKFNHDFRKWVKKHNLVDAYDKPITVHGMRHNFATMGVKSEMDIASLSRMLGHSSRAMTLDIYADADRDALVTASDKLGKQFGE